MSDYKNNTTLHLAQMTMLDILKAVHQICEDNDIRYWLDAGTLLGCVRHKGFIPWDDDIDIAMPREDFAKFISIAQPLLPKDMLLQTKSADIVCASNITKVRKLGTKYIQYGETDCEPYHQGIFIDIFPFDYYPSKRFTKFIRWIDDFRNLRKKYKSKIIRLLANIYVNFIAFAPMKICRIYKTYVASRHDKFFANPNLPVMGHRLNVCATTGIYQKDIFPLKKEIEFEGIKFYMPNNYHAYLIDEFGKDYMTLPPIDKRKTHAREILLHTGI
jgi:lipopolysaccharide cholinephosphotransferase